MFRNAKIEDRSEFLDLWGEYLRELEKYGSEIEPDLDSLRPFRDLFDAYVMGDLAGSCVLFDPPGEGLQGATLVGEDWGKSTIPRKKMGRLAYAWGIYLTPKWRKRNIAQDIWVNTGKKLIALGFDTLLGDILVDNKVSQAACQGVGWEQHAIVHTMDLREWKHGSDR